MGVSDLTVSFRLFVLYVEKLHWYRAHWVTLSIATIRSQVNPDRTMVRRSNVDIPRKEVASLGKIGDTGAREPTLPTRY